MKIEISGEGKYGIQSFMPKILEQYPGIFLPQIFGQKLGR